MLRRFLAVLILASLVEAATFALYYDDLLYLRRPVAVITSTPRETFERHATDALNRSRLTRQHLDTLAEAAQAFGLGAIEFRALQRLATVDPSDPGVRVRLADAMRRAVPVARENGPSDAHITPAHGTPGAEFVAISRSAGVPAVALAKPPNPRWRQEDGLIETIDAISGQTATLGADLLADVPGAAVVALVDARAPVGDDEDDDPEIPPGPWLARDIARVHQLAAAERWEEAVAASNAAVIDHPQEHSVQSLRADVLSWAGRHDEGIAAYEAYLALVPADISARRQQARVAGWAGKFTDARGYYERLRALVPDNAEVAAEMRAKLAFFSGRWRDAVRFYDEWLTLEPANSEARFEHAEALRAAGDPARADAALATLAADTNHRLAIAARNRSIAEQAWSVALSGAQQATSGYQGTRLLNLVERGLAARKVFGESLRTAFVAEATALTASATDVERRGYRTALSASSRIGSRLTSRGSIGIVDLGLTGAPIIEAQGDASWAPVDRWTITAGLGREALFENIATIDRRLAASGVFTRVDFAASDASLDARATWQVLSDGNRRRSVQGAATHTLGERFRHVRVVAWGEVLSFARESTTYFSPAGFMRLDGGAEYTRAFTTPRFRGDRQDELTGGYLFGFDSRGTLYHHPSVRLAREVSSGIRFEARADLVRSATYRAASFHVSVRLSSASTR